MIPRFSSLYSFIILRTGKIWGAILVSRRTTQGILEGTYPSKGSAPDLLGKFSLPSCSQVGKNPGPNTYVPNLFLPTWSFITCKPPPQYLKVTHEVASHLTLQAPFTQSIFLLPRTDNVGSLQFLFLWLDSPRYILLSWALHISIWTPSRYYKSCLPITTRPKSSSPPPCCGGLHVSMRHYLSWSYRPLYSQIKILMHWPCSSPIPTHDWKTPHFYTCTLRYPVNCQSYPLNLVGATPILPKYLP